MVKINDVDNTYLEFAEAAAPGTPASAVSRIYVKADGLFYSKDDAGVETLMSSGSSGSVATDTIWDTKGDLAAATGADAASKLAAGANDTVLMAASGQATGLKWSYPVLTVSENFITGNVTVTSANTFYDGPSLTLAAGTYFLSGHLVTKVGSINTFCVAKLWDGTNIFDAVEIYQQPTGGANVFPVSGTCVLGGSTTVKISYADNSGGGTILATPATNNTGLTNKASHLVAVRIA